MPKPLSLLYPDQCVSCGTLVDGTQALCGKCWGETPFLAGLCCDACGAALLGEAAGARPLCDGCMEHPPAWDRGRAVLEYRDNGRKLVMALKHGDRLDLARPFGRWMAERGRPLLAPETLVVPVPLHWTRLARRRFNQSALLAREIARAAGARACLDALTRTRRTVAQEDMTRAERAANMDGALAPHPRRGARLAGRDVVLVDDVMTSGATLGAAAGAARAAGAAGVSVLVLARVAKPL